MINAYSYNNPVEAHDAMIEQLVWGTTLRDRDYSHGTEVALHNVAIHCDTIDFNYNFKKLWVPPSRWTMMVRQYIDPGAYQDCLNKITERMAGPKYGGRQGRGVAVLRTRMVQGKGTGRGVRRRWGSCMLNLSFRRNPVPTVSLHSRTTYFGYLALVDVAVARTFAQTCSEVTGIPLGEIQFVWTLDMAQFHGFRSLAWMLGDKEIREDMDDNVDNRQAFPSSFKDGHAIGYRKALDGYARILKSDRAGTLYGDESFSSFARVRRRFHTEVFGEGYAAQFNGGSRTRTSSFGTLPDLWVSDLTFGGLVGRTGESEWFEDDEEDED